MFMFASLVFLCEFLAAIRGEQRQGKYRPMRAILALWDSILMFLTEDVILYSDERRPGGRRLGLTLPRSNRRFTRDKAL